MRADPTTSRLATIGVSAIVLVSACGSGSQGSSVTLAGGVPETVAIGVLPESSDDAEPPPNPPTTPPSSAPPAPTTTIPADEQITPPLGAYVFGRRLLLIGDSILVSTSPRVGGLMCDVLTDFGWDVELDAETGRFVEFGNRVLDERFRPDNGLNWDTAAVFLGNNFDGDVEAYSVELNSILDRLQPRPVILYTVTEIDAGRVAINEIIRAMPDVRAGIVVVDWARITAEEPDQLLVGDGLHLTQRGAEQLVVFTAATLGTAPGGVDGRCLPSPFQDDSRVG